MIKITPLRNCFLAFAVIAVTACSKDDDSGSDLMSGVPKGEIVPADEREAVLIGYDTDGLQQNPDEQKWWKHVVSNVTIDCDEYEDVSETLENTYFAFKENGTLYYKTGLNGTEYATYEWEWANSSKDAIIMQGVTFDFTELNPNAVTYASVQSAEGCNAVTWEKFSN